MITRLFLQSMLVLSLVSCRKNKFTIPPIPSPAFSQGTLLTISKGQDLSTPRIDLAPDTVYTVLNNGFPKFKPLPTGFDDAIVSFYLPKGFMVVLAENSDGSGESVCYVASQSPIKATLPAELRGKVSFVRYKTIVNGTKKGFAATDSNVVKTFTSSWYYGWSINRPSFGTQQFVPMTWGKGSATPDNVNYLVNRSDVDHLLSFNEPDHIPQSNIPIIDTATFRYKIMLATGLRMVSPACTQDAAFGAGRWLTDFMAAAKNLKLRVDVVALHWYDWGNHTNNQPTDSLTAQSVFNRFKTYIERVRSTYPDKRIWITEYNANINRTSPVIHKYFMKLSTEWLNTLSYVERYAYFFPAPLPAVNATGAMTDMGMYWNSLPSPVSFPLNID